MKKQGLLVAFAVLVTLLVATCSPETNAPSFEEFYIAPQLQIHPELENLVSMVVTDVTATDITVTIQNNSDLRLSTGSPFTLEVYYNGQWLHAPAMNPVAFTFVDIGIEPHGSRSFSKYLAPFPPLGAERYMIRKDVDIMRWQLPELPDGTVIPLPPPPPDVPVATPPPPPPAEIVDETISDAESETAIYFHPELIDGIPTPPPPRGLPSHEVVAEFDWGR